MLVNHFEGIPLIKMELSQQLGGGDIEDRWLYAGCSLPNGRSRGMYVLPS